MLSPTLNPAHMQSFHMQRVRRQKHHTCSSDTASLICCRGTAMLSASQNTPSRRPARSRSVQGRGSKSGRGADLASSLPAAPPPPPPPRTAADGLTGGRGRLARVNRGRAVALKRVHPRLHAFAYVRVCINQSVAVSSPPLQHRRSKSGEQRVPLLFAWHRRWGELKDERRLYTVDVANVIPEKFGAP
jgi:hypothetical protein